MRAVVIDDVKATPEVREVPRPAPPADGVVVRVMATGMCRSDWHAWAGHDGDVIFPHVPGHELAGVIEEVGPHVRAWRVGDRVTVPFVCGCGLSSCEWCTSGNAQVCPDQQQPGFTHWGSFAELVALHAADANLVAIPDGVDFATAASLGCRFATAYRALISRARIAPNEWVVIFGAGGVGLSAVMIAKAIGARVIAVDRNPEALDVARSLGAEVSILAGGSRTDGAANPVGSAGSPEHLRSDDVPAAVSELTAGGAHVSIDAVGSEQTSRDAVLSLRRRGRHVQVGLLPTDDGLARVPMARAIAWELDILGSHGMAAGDYPGMLALIAEGRLAPQRLIERTIGLEEAAALLPRFDRATVAGMTMVDPRL